MCQTSIHTYTHTTQLYGSEWDYVQTRSGEIQCKDPVNLYVHTIQYITCTIYRITIIYIYCITSPCVSLCPSVCLSPSLSLLPYLSVCLSLSPSVSLSIYLSLCLSVSLSLSISLSLSLSLSLSPSPSFFFSSCAPTRYNQYIPGYT